MIKKVCGILSGIPSVKIRPKESLHAETQKCHGDLSAAGQIQLPGMR
jgi:hypothetical protein